MDPKQLIYWTASCAFLFFLTLQLLSEPTFKTGSWIIIMCRCCFQNDHFNDTSERYLNQRHSTGFIKQSEKEIHLFISLPQKISLLTWEIVFFFVLSIEMCPLSIPTDPFCADFLHTIHYRHIIIILQLLFTAAAC